MFLFLLVIIITITFFLFLYVCVCVCVCMRFISGARQVTEGTTLITRCRDLSYYYYHYYYYYYYYRLIHQLGIHYTKRIFSDDHNGGGCVNSCACICFRQPNTVRRPWPRKLYVWVLLLFVLLLLCCYVKSRRECAGIAFSNCPLDALLECLDISHRLWNQNNIISVLQRWRFVFTTAGLLSALLGGLFRPIMRWKTFHLFIFWSRKIPSKYHNSPTHCLLCNQCVQWHLISFNFYDLESTSFMEFEYTNWSLDVER